MLPTITIIGRQNVGKSTLFNRLTSSKQALVADQNGLTRDRQYGYVNYDNKSFIVVDTGGICDKQHNEIDQSISQQCEKAILEADSILFVVDAKDGLTYEDEYIANKLRIFKKPIFLAVNKIDLVDPFISIPEFYKAGFGKPIPISSAHSRGIDTLVKHIHNLFPDTDIQDLETQQAIKIAIVGKPNVGKSTLINRLLGEERMIVSDKPGTTRDSIFIPFKYNYKTYILIDTAGIRRRTKITEKIEKFSVIKTLQAIYASNVVVFLIDGQEGISDQDQKLLGLILESGKALVFVVNKWDGLTIEKQELIKQGLSRKLSFLHFVKWHFISALQGFEKKRLLSSIKQAYDSATKKLTTPQLNKALQLLIEKHQPPLVKGRRIKLRYAHVGGNNPPIIVIHGNQVKSLSKSYKRYLEKGFRKIFNLVGTPIQIELRQGENPYQDSGDRS